MTQPSLAVSGTCPEPSFRPLFARAVASLSPWSLFGALWALMLAFPRLEIWPAFPLAEGSIFPGSGDPEALGRGREPELKAGDPPGIRERGRGPSPEGRGRLKAKSSSRLEESGTAISSGGMDTPRRSRPTGVTDRVLAGDPPCTRNVATVVGGTGTTEAGDPPAVDPAMGACMTACGASARLLLPAGAWAEGPVP